MTETNPLAGQVALVTGASSGLGRATALALARAGASVALVARSVSDLAAVAEEVRAGGRSALPLAGDLADADDLHDAVRKAREQLGPLRVLVNAAGPMRRHRSASSVSRTGTACSRSTCAPSSCCVG